MTTKNSESDKEPQQNGSEPEFSTLPVRSILKKATFDLNSSTTNGEAIPNYPPKKISFSDNITTHWGDDVTVDDRKAHFCSSLPESQGSSDMAENRSKNMLSVFKSGIKNRVGSIWKHSSRAQVQEDPRGFECSDSVLTFSKSKRRSSEPINSSAVLPRLSSLDSSGLFSVNNQNFKSRFMRFGKYFKHDSQQSDDDGVPVLTKVTQLGALFKLSQSSPSQSSISHLFLCSYLYVHFSWCPTFMGVLTN